MEKIELRILIVDDEEQIPELLKHFLENFFVNDELFLISVKTAFNGSVGIKLATEFRPNVVFSDLKMPGISGIDMIREIRKHLNPVVIFCCSNIPSIEHDAYFEKPVLPREVLPKIKQLFLQKFQPQLGVEKAKVIPSISV